MGRASTRENKNIYQTTREALHLTREAAGELLESIPPERIEKIENERSLPHPDEVLTMAEKYKQPGLCNYYCANQCPIGQEYVPEVKIKDLSQIVLEMCSRRPPTAFASSERPLGENRLQGVTHEIYH